MERALNRAGFTLSEDTSADTAEPPDLVLVAVREAGAELERILTVCRSRDWIGVPVIALLGAGGPAGSRARCRWGGRRDSGPGGSGRASSTPRGEAAVPRRGHPGRWSGLAASRVFVPRSKRRLRPAARTSCSNSWWAGSEPAGRRSLRLPGSIQDGRFARVRGGP
jgi:hypothetical protein